MRAFAWMPPNRPPPLPPQAGAGRGIFTMSQSSGCQLSRRLFSLILFSLMLVMRNAAHLVKWAALQTREGLHRTVEAGHEDLRPSTQSERAPI